jgi:hypothetical protein
MERDYRRISLIMSRFGDEITPLLGSRARYFIGVKGDYSIFRDLDLLSAFG